MPRSNGTQTRTFTYQSGTNWLLTATNPENGTVTYTRDAMGHVTKRVDAMGQTTNYTYDSYNRLTQVTRRGSGRIPTRARPRLTITTRPSIRVSPAGLRGAS